MAPNAPADPNLGQLSFNSFLGKTFITVILQHNIHDNLELEMRKGKTVELMI